MTSTIPLTGWIQRRNPLLMRRNRCSRTARGFAPDARPEQRRKTGALGWLGFPPEADERRQNRLLGGCRALRERERDSPGSFDVPVVEDFQGVDVAAPDPGEQVGIGQSAEVAAHESA